MTADILEFRTKKLTGFIPESDEPKPELPDGEVIYCSPPIKDTAPSEYSAPDDGDCA